LDVTTGAKLFDPAGNLIDVGDLSIPGTGATAPQWALEARPNLKGEAFISYSVVLQTWLPARPEMVAPDGMHYAYMAPDRSIHLVDPKTQTDQVAIASNPNDLNPIGYSTDGVWLVQGPGPGLWVLDPATKAVTQVRPPSAQEFWGLMRGGAIWGANTGGGVGAPPPSALLHFDLKTHAVTTWYSKPGGTVQLAAVDAIGAAAILVSSGSTTTVFSVTAPGVASTLSLPSGTRPSDLMPQETDSHGGWIVTPSGIYLFALKSGVQRIGPGSTSDIVPAGECLQS
jgi:hypothetical protein